MIRCRCRRSPPRPHRDLDRRPCPRRHHPRPGRPRRARVVRQPRRPRGRAGGCTGRGRGPAPGDGRSGCAPCS
ncbi:hypothetical protein DKG74_20800 [Zavarzinia aquatilis]|uniref:Uncharacterized protein n=1 Tax=Zavarzinia aquatilis TaxID=2211142 RepID=A0A317DSK5_9PROT|nr:hypothetical protein DKG74_20800 [Zavarzinia aquatilis]